MAEHQGESIHNDKRYHLRQLVRNPEALRSGKGNIGKWTDLGNFIFTVCVAENQADDDATIMPALMRKLFGRAEFEEDVDVDGEFVNDQIKSERAWKQNVKRIKQKLKEARVSKDAKPSIMEGTTNMTAGSASSSTTPSPSTHQPPSSSRAQNNKPQSSDLIDLVSSPESPGERAHPMFRDCIDVVANVKHHVSSDGYKALLVEVTNNRIEAKRIVQGNGALTFDQSDRSLDWLCHEMEQLGVDPEQIVKLNVDPNPTGLQSAKGKQKQLQTEFSDAAPSRTREKISSQSLSNRAMSIPTASPPLQRAEHRHSSSARTLSSSRMSALPGRSSTAPRMTPSPRPSSHRGQSSGQHDLDLKPAQIQLLKEDFTEKITKAERTNAPADHAKAKRAMTLWMTAEEHVES